MAQFNWLYLGDNGRQYNVGVFHGDRTGHLMVMCNARIVLIDFSVKDPKDYSFFIDDELFELSVKGQPGRYDYKCVINEEADTPRNRVRKKQKKLDFRKTVALIGVFILIIIGTLGFVMASQKSQSPEDRAANLSRDGMETVARVFLGEKASEKTLATLRYSFIANGHVQEYEQVLDSAVANGFPLQDGDEFRVRYLLNNPKTNRLELDRPTTKQLSRYLDRTIQQHQALNPSLSNSQAQCQVNVAYKLGGLKALAVVYHQDAPEQSHPVFNELSYKRLVRDIPFREAVEQSCWR